MASSSPSTSGSLENSVDPVHTSFVYRKTEPHWREVPEVSAETSEHGLVLTTVRSGEKRITRYYFPNLMRITVFLIPGEDLEFPHFLWHVPIDDENSMFISATAVPAHLRDRIPQAQAGRVMAEGAAADLLSARRPPASITEEDYVAMVGQGVVADRTNERLGRSDVGVVQLRPGPESSLGAFGDRAGCARSGATLRQWQGVRHLHRRNLSSSRRRA